MSPLPPRAPEERIAIVGMACRVPGAPHLEAFWRNLVEGVESIETLTPAELRAAGVPEALIRDPRYVPRGGFLPDMDCFDEGLFGCNPREAAMLDPQHRLLMECAWHALEHAGHGAIDRSLRVGVYAGVANSAYYHAHVRPSLDPRDTSSAYQALICGERDFVATRLAYFFDLAGPSLGVQTACSTSLVAVHLACQALLSGECDMTLAGGAAVRLPQRAGYLYEEGMILSRDGHCRPFDAEASGTVVGNGAGIVVLRRLEDALADGDTVHAVILASAVNNDGSCKVGYTAPGVEGQAGVVVEAQTLAGVSPETIGFIEAHGTGTAIGDPIEVAALTDVFRGSTAARGFCALGSVKSNIGHLDIAAGVVGLIKAALAVSRGVIPPSLHFRRANPALALETTPFFVPTSAQPWGPHPTRRAGVSSFGIGGTNAHVVLEAVKALPTSPSSRPWQVLCVSARTPAASARIGARLAEQLSAENAPDLADVAFTLSTGRRALGHRMAVVCAQAADAAASLRAIDKPREAIEGRRVAWVFPGEDAAYPGMGQGLAASEPAYRSAHREAMAALAAFAPSPADAALFAMEYALAALWHCWGVEPQVVLGFGKGEYAAAVASGEITLVEAARLMAAPTGVDHLRARRGERSPDEALRALLEDRDRVVLEVGPGATIGMRAWPKAEAGTLIVASCDRAFADEARAIAEAAATLWRSGVVIDWRGYHGGEKRRRVALPPYPFERTRRWIEAPARSTAAEVSRTSSGRENAASTNSLCVFRTTWTRAPKLPPPPKELGGCWLIVGELQGLAARLAARLQAGGGTVTRAPLDSPACREALRAGRAPRILHLGASYESLVSLGRAIISERAPAADAVALFAVTEDLHAVTGIEAADPAKALALGPLRVLPQEYPEIGCRNIDLAKDASVESVDALLAECLADEVPAIVALRGRHRWRPSVERVELPRIEAGRAATRPVYLITGGAGRVGLALARHLHEKERARLVLVGRSPLPPPGEWDAAADAVATFEIGGEGPPSEDSRMERMQALAAMRRDGAELLYVAADASSEREMRRAFAAAETAFGRVDVVVHAAAAPAREIFTPFEDLDAEVAARHFAPKVAGVEAIRALAREKRLSACVLMSSLASALGGLGFTAYAAANAYLDAVAQAEDGVNGVRWTSIGWDAWQSANSGTRSAINGTSGQHAIVPAEGVAIFSRLLEAGIGPHVLVSSTDLEERVARSSRAQAREASDPAFELAERASANAASTEEVIASAWQELLGVETVERDDDFYDLGGNSLLATQVVSRLRRAFGIDLSVRVLFEQTTVASLARHVDSLPRAKAADGSPIAP